LFTGGRNFWFSACYLYEKTRRFSWHLFVARIGKAFYKLHGAFLPDKTL